MWGGFNPRDCKLKCMQGGNRIKLVSNKKEAELVNVEKQVADYIKAKNLEMAMMRVEQVLRIKNTLRAFEYLTLFLEMIKQRSELVAKSKAMPEDMRTSICSVIYASTRIHEIPELVDLRKSFESKYGKKEVARCSDDQPEYNAGVQVRLVDALSLSPPMPEVKVTAAQKIMDKYCSEEEKQEAHVLWKAMGMEEPVYAPPPDPVHSSGFVAFPDTFGSSEQPTVHSNVPPGALPDSPVSPQVHTDVQPDYVQRNDAQQGQQRVQAAPQQQQQQQLWGPPSASHAPSAAPANATASGAHVTPDQPANYLAALEHAMNGMQAPSQPYLDTTNPGPEYYSGSDVGRVARGSGFLPVAPPPGSGGKNTVASQQANADNRPPSIPTEPRSPTAAAQAGGAATLPYSGGKTREQLQAEYDAAPGAPGKGDKSALPGVAQANYPDVPVPDTAGQDVGSLSDLPAAPQREHDAVPVDSENGEESVTMDLQERLERLRKGIL